MRYWELTNMLQYAILILRLGKETKRHHDHRKNNHRNSTGRRRVQPGLAQIKAIAGRKFDSSTKTWSVPISAKELKAKVSLPIEMPNGDHVTRYGNTYSHGEWAAEQEYKAVSVHHGDARQAVRQWLEDELGKWIAADKVAQIAGIIESAKLPALIENGTIRTTAEKIAALYAIEDGYYKRMEEVHQAEDAAEEVQRDAIAAKYGLDY